MLRIDRRASLALLALLPACATAAPASQDVCSQGAAEALTAAETSCATGATVSGVDVSTYDGTVDWPSAKAAGIDFAFARISDGTANPDDQFAANWPGMKSAGIIRGAYQYWRASVDPTAQAELVLSSLKSAGGLVGGDLPVVMDIETDDGEDAATIEANMKTWLAAVHAGTGRVPIVYTSVGTYPITVTTFSTYPLWVANYGVTCPTLPVGWTGWLFWQSSDTGSVSGVGSSSDLDEFNGSLAQLRSFADANEDDAGTGAGHADAGDDVDAGEAPHGADAGAVHDGGSSGATGDAGAVMGAGRDAGVGVTVPTGSCAR